MMVTIIGRGHSGTRSISHTLTASGFYMGGEINGSGDLIPPEKMYDACRIFAKHVHYLGNMKWDFSEILESEPDEEFKELINGYLETVLSYTGEYKGWKIPETTLVYPWIIKMFPDIHYIHWVRDPRDCILNGHLTDDLSDFGIEYDKTDDIRLRRAISWKYQRELMNATPDPKNVIRVKFEDMVLNTEDTLKRLSSFLGKELTGVEMRKDSVGRYKTDDGVHMFDFFKEDIETLNYEIEK